MNSTALIPKPPGESPDTRAQVRSSNPGHRRAIEEVPQVSRVVDRTSEQGLCQQMQQNHPTTQQLPGGTTQLSGRPYEVHDDHYVQMAIQKELQDMYSKDEKPSDLEDKITALKSIGRPSVRVSLMAATVQNVLLQGPAAVAPPFRKSGPAGYLACVADVDDAVDATTKVLDQGLLLGPKSSSHRSSHEPADAQQVQEQVGQWWGGPAAEATTVARQLLVARLRNRIGQIVKCARLRAKGLRKAASDARSTRDSGAALALPPYRGETAIAGRKMGPAPWHQIRRFEDRCIDEAASDYRAWWASTRVERGLDPDAWDVRPPGFEGTEGGRHAAAGGAGSDPSGRASAGGSSSLSSSSSSSSSTDARAASSEAGKGSVGATGGPDWCTAIAKTQLLAGPGGAVSAGIQLANANKLVLSQLHPHSSLAWLRFAVRRRFQRVLSTGSNSTDRNSQVGVQNAVRRAVESCKQLPLLHSELAIEGGDPLPAPAPSKEPPPSSPSPGSSAAAAAAASSGTGSDSGAPPSQSVLDALPPVAQAGDEAATMLVARAREAVWLSDRVAQAAESGRHLAASMAMYKQLQSVRRRVLMRAIQLREVDWKRYEEAVKRGVPPVQLRRPRSRAKAIPDVPYNATRMGIPAQGFIQLSIYFSHGNIPPELRSLERTEVFRPRAKDSEGARAGAAADEERDGASDGKRAEDSSNGAAAAAGVQSVVAKTRHLMSMQDVAAALSTGRAGGGLRDRAAARKAAQLAASATPAVSAAAAEMSVEFERRHSALQQAQRANRRLVQSVMDFAGQYGHLPGTAKAQMVMQKARNERPAWRPLFDVDRFIAEKMADQARFMEQQEALRREAVARVDIKRQFSQELEVLKALGLGDHTLGWNSARLQEVLMCVRRKPLQPSDFQALAEKLPRLSGDMLKEFFKYRATQSDSSQLDDVNFAQAMVDQAAATAAQATAGGASQGASQQQPMH